MYYQTDEFFNNKIRRYGCNLFCLLKISELEATERYSPQLRFNKHEIEMIYYDAMKRGLIDKDCVVKKPGDVIKLGFRYLTSRKIEAYQVGVEEEDETTFWGWVDGKYKNYKYKIVRWSTYNGNEHFTLWKDDEEIYDPYHEDIKDYIKNKLLYYIGG